MTLKLYQWGMKISTFLSLLGWVLVLNYIDPDSSGLIGKFLFYLSLFLAVTGMFTLIFTSIRKKFTDDETAPFYIVANIRQGMLIGVMVVILLLFQSIRILTWWDGLLVLAGIFVIELYFLTNARK